MEVIETMGIVKYNITDATISEMKDRYMGLTVKDFDDKEGFDAVHEARMVVKGKRVDVEKRRKELKADALEYGRKVDTEAKRIFGLLEPIETHLQTEEDKITKEKERRKAEEERKFKEKVDKRVSDLFSVNKVMDFMTVASMTDEVFEETLKQAAEEYQAEQKRIAEEKAAREAEEARLKTEREENERKEAELEAEREKIEAEKRAFEEEKRKEQERKDREEFERQSKIQAEIEAKEKFEREQREKEEAEHKARVEAEERAKREAEEKAEIECKAKEEAERIEKLRPDREKLIEWAREITSIRGPEVSSKEAQEIIAQAEKALDTVGMKIISHTEVM
jgi:hypothetical protein